MEMKIVGVTLAAFVSLVVLAAVLVPILDDATATTDTFKNDGYFRMTEISADDDTTHTILWDATTSNILTVDDVAMDVTTMGFSNGQQITVFAGNEDFFRITIASDGSGMSAMQTRGLSVTYANATSMFSAEIASGTATILVDSDATPKTVTYTDAYMIDPTNTGAYVMKKSNESAYLLNDSTIYGIGVSFIAPGNITSYMRVSGTIESVTAECIFAGSNTVTISNTTVNATADSDHKDLYKFDSVSFTATCQGSNTNVTYSYIVVPYEVTAEKAVHLSNNQNELLAVIPVLVIVAILLGVVALVIRSKLE